MRLEVIVFGKYAGTDEFLLQDTYKIKKVLGIVVAYVIDFVGRNRQTVFAVPLLGSVPHHADDAFDDVVHVREVALAVTVVEYLYRLAPDKLVREAEIGHVGTAGGAVDGEEAKAGARDVVEFGVGVRHQFIAFFRGCIQADGIVHLVLGTIRNFLVGAIYT